MCCILICYSVEHIPRRGRLPTEPGPYCSEIGHTSPLISSPMKSPPYNYVGIDISDDNSCKCMFCFNVELLLELRQFLVILWRFVTVIDLLYSRLDIVHCLRYISIHIILELTALPPSDDWLSFFHTNEKYSMFCFHI
jgi:hypothetical protein